MWTPKILHRPANDIGGVRLVKEICVDRGLGVGRTANTGSGHATGCDEDGRIPNMECGGAEVGGEAGRWRQRDVAGIA